MPPGTGGLMAACSCGVMTVLAELGCTCTTPVSEVGGTGWVGSLATAAMWLARPSVMLAVESVFSCGVATDAAPVVAAV